MAGVDSFVKRTVQNSVSGTVAGVAVVMVGHPFDTLKVRLQTQPVHKPVYSGLLDCFVKTVKWEGVSGFYRGVASPLLGQMFYRATLFTTYYQVNNLVTGPGRTGQRLSFTEYYLCGAVTGGMASFVEGPMDLFKTKMQVQIIRAKSGGDVQYRNVFHAGGDIYKKYGFRGCYQGLSPTLLRNVPALGVYFSFYELTRSAFMPPGGDVADLPFWATMTAGGVGGFMHWVVIYPLDVVKSAMQSDESEPRRRRFASVAHCTRTLYLEEGGWRRFTRGFIPCLMRSVPANAVMLLTLEKFRGIMSEYSSSS